MAESGFKLKAFENIFAVTDPNNAKNETIYNLTIDKLLPFKEHPFKLYSGERFSDMVDSIKANGILVPIIVRPTDQFTYEILSGHNRVECAKAAELLNIPAIVKENLSDEEALLIVTETNLIQRSFTDLSHSERALTLSMHYEAIKKQGKRNDLIFEIESMVKGCDLGISETCSPMGNKSKMMTVIGKNYELSKNSVARYLRINKLTPDFKEMLDNGEMPIRAGVDLSYLPEDELHIAYEVLNGGNYTVDMKKAAQLRQLSESKRLTAESVEEIFAGKIICKKQNSAPPVKIKHKSIAKYFSPAQKPKEIEETILKALEFYFSHSKNDNNNKMEVT